MVYRWQAYRLGHVTALWARHDTLWTGSSRGNVRVWPLKDPKEAIPGGWGPECLAMQ
jgi:hypothetical protein